MCKDPDEQPQGGEQLSALNMKCRQVDSGQQPHTATPSPPQAIASQTGNSEEGDKNASVRKKETPRMEDTLSDDKGVSATEPTNKQYKINITDLQSREVKKKRHQGGS